MSENETVPLRLIPDARQALTDAAAFYTQTETDTANQALQLYGWLAREVVVEHQTLAMVGPDGMVRPVELHDAGGVQLLSAGTPWPAPSSPRPRLHPLAGAGLVALFGAVAAAVALSDWRIAAYGVLVLAGLSVVGGMLAERRPGRG